MGVFRFESNGVRKPHANAAKVIHFDGSPMNTLGREYGLRNITLRNERLFRGKEDMFDVYAQRSDGEIDGKEVLSAPYKIGELFYHAPDYPGGPARRMPVSTSYEQPIIK